MRNFPRLSRACLSIALASLAVLAPATAAGAAEPPTGFHDTTVFEGLKEPTVFRFAPDGRVFVAQKDGKIVVFDGLHDTEPTLFANLSKQVFDYGDKGILGLALDPKFEAGRPYVYVLYTYDHKLGEKPAEGEPGWAPRWGRPPSYEGDECPEELGACVVSGRLVRLTAAGSGEAIHAAPAAEEPEEDVLIEDWCQQFSSHSIGDLQFGPEGALFVSGGEGASFVNSDFGQYGNPCGDPPGKAGENLSPPDAEGGSLRAQDVRTLGDPTGLDGAVLRVNPEDGEAWPGNPFSGSSDLNARKIIGYGFRNPFRFTIDPRHGEVYVDNVGNGTDEEIDRFPIGSSQAYNSGWPCYEGLAPEPGFAFLGLRVCEELYAEPESTSPPFFYYTHAAPVAPGDPCPTYNGSAISGSAFYEGMSYPSKYHDALFFADAVRGCIYVMRADPDGEPDPSLVEPFLSEEGVYPAVDIEQGPEGDLFYASLFGGPEEGTIHRISYNPGAPQARLTVDQAWGPTTKTFHFDASASTDPEGHQLEYAWDLNEDGNYEDATGATVADAFNDEANHLVAVRVTDEVTQEQSVAKLTVFPGDSPPRVEITEPEASLTWGVTQVIHFAGHAIEREGTGNPVPEKNLYWKMRLLHCPFEAGSCHEHPLQVFPGVEEGNLTAPDHDYPSAIKAFLTATDARGLATTETVEILARPAPIGFESVPAGVTLTAGLKTQPAPFELTAIESSPITISAPSTATVGGVEYAFKEWSDGGARVHTVIAGRGGPYAAIYQAVPGEASEPGGATQPAAAPAPTEPPLPDTTLLRHPPDRTYGTTAIFRFASDQPGAWFQCSLDHGPYRHCASPRVYRHLEVGVHRVRIRALTQAGWPDPTPAEFTWRVRRR